jgi:hypothetical protein
MEKFKCTCCGKIIEEWPALTFNSPNNYECLTDDDKKKIGFLNNDFCKINNENQTDRFIRCILIQKVNDNCQDLDYGVWVSLSEKNYYEYEENFKNETEEKTYFGWLCNNIPGYEFIESIPLNVVINKKGLRPEVFPHYSFEHQFVKDYYNGISKIEAEKRINKMLGIKNIKWWEIWK